MRKFQSRLILALTFVTVTLGPSVSHAQRLPSSSGSAPGSRPAAVKPGQIMENPVAQAVASSTVTRNGKSYPQVPTGSGADTASTGGASCELGDTQSFSQGASIHNASPNHVKKSNQYGPVIAVFSPPNADWVIQSYSRVVTSAGDPYQASDSSFPAGYSFLTAAAFSSVRNNVHNFVTGLNIADMIKIDLKTQIDSMISNISSYTVSLGGSHGTVQHSATVWGTGILPSNKGHSWYDGYINGTLTCAPTYLRDENALTYRLKVWVNNVVRKLPVPVSTIPKQS